MAMNSDVKHWISFSGGKGSAATVLLAHILGYDFEMIMADTGIEDEDLWRFTDDVAKFVGKEVIILRTGKTPWDVYREKRYIGNTRTAHCSTELKTKPVMRFLNKYAGASEPLVLGMNLGEIDRIDRAALNWSPRPVKSLLCEYQWGNRFIDHLFAWFGIELPRLYKMGFPHNNCGGFCCKAGLTQFNTLLERLPGVYAKHEKEMGLVMKDIGDTARPFLRKKANGETQYLTLTDFRERVERNEIDVPLYEFGGCGCFSDEL